MCGDVLEEEADLGLFGVGEAEVVCEGEGVGVVWSWAAGAPVGGGGIGLRGIGVGVGVGWGDIVVVSGVLSERVADGPAVSRAALTTLSLWWWVFRYPFQY